MSRVRRRAKEESPRQPVMAGRCEAPSTRDRARFRRLGSQLPGVPDLRRPVTTRGQVARTSSAWPRAPSSARRGQKSHLSSTSFGRFLNLAPNSTVMFNHGIRGSEAASEGLLKCRPSTPNSPDCDGRFRGERGY